MASYKVVRFDDYPEIQFYRTMKPPTCVADLPIDLGKYPAKSILVSEVYLNTCTQHPSEPKLACNVCYHLVLYEGLIF